MRICAIVKYPPIQGGVSARCYWIARSLAERGHQVHVVTNALEVEQDYRILIPEEDRPRLEARFENGGLVSLTCTGQDERQVAHIPKSNPFVSKLSSMATEVIRRHRCEVVFSYYYEPYSLAGLLASSWTNIPHVVQHAGSDRGRLMAHPDLAISYREMLLRATIVVTGDRSLEGLGIPPERFSRGGVSFLPRGLFTPDGPALDVAKHLESVSEHVHTKNPAPFRPELPTFGIIGKIGTTKGSYDLIVALATLRQRGRDFQLLALAAGTDRQRFLEICDSAGIGDRVWALPLMPHWRVPSFLRACTAVCFLEREFPIIAHTPGIPTEILATGTCMVVSREIADKQNRLRGELRSGENVFVVEDPKDTEQLVAALDAVIADPLRARRMGAAGANLVETGDEEQLGGRFERILERAIALHARSQREATSRSGPQREIKTATVRAFLARNMPATTRLYAKEIDALLADGSTPPLRDQPDTALPDTAACRAYHLAERLVRELAARPAQGQDVGLHIAKFELDLLWLGTDLEGPRGIPQFPPSAEPVPALMRKPTKPIRPVRSNWLRATRHPVEIERAIKDVLADVPTEQISFEPSRATTYVFKKQGDLVRRVFAINPATAEFLELCDGSRSLRQIVAILEKRGVPAAGNLPPIITRMAQERVLWFA